MAQRYLSDAVPTVTDALQGARDIVAERMSEDVDARQRVRNLFEREALIRSTVKKGKETDGLRIISTLPNPSGEYLRTDYWPCVGAKQKVF